MKSQFKELYPHLSDDELEEVEKTLRQYISVVLRLMDSLESDPEAMREYKALAKYFKKQNPR